MDINRTYADWDTQMAMYEAWEAWVAGRGPKPNHSRAVHPRESDHTAGVGLDSDDWTDPEFVELAADHGWIRTHASDPTERHHFKYLEGRDNHRNRPSASPQRRRKHMELWKITDDYNGNGGGPGWWLVNEATSGFLFTNDGLHVGRTWAVGYGPERAMDRYAAATCLTALALTVPASVRAEVPPNARKAVAV
ncbi:hypothetical protein MRBLWO14_001161 [Microbacterium sp. LWO14-1.2]|uniref:hypothetical protein n=1 Tax=Microbacterium sp. LWO14-1.2 TaxID=3135263 RepID=UPI0031393965